MSPSQQQVAEQVTKVVSELQTQFDVWLHHQIFDNQFLIAGIGTVALGAIAYVLRALPRRIWNFFLRLTTVQLTINNDTEAFLHVLRRLDRSRIRMLQRTFLLADGSSDDDRYDDDGVHLPSSKRLAWTVGPGLGRSVCTFEGRPLVGWLTREKSDSREFKMSLDLRFIGRSSKRVRRFVKSIHDESIRSRNGINIYSASIAGHWNTVVREKYRRPLASVFLPADIKAKLLERLTWFYANEQWYRDRGLPYKMGVLLYGVPGSGKSSLIHALASELDKNIRMLNLNAMTDSSTSIMKNLGGRDFLVIEDIDTFSVVGQRKAMKQAIVSEQRNINDMFAGARNQGKKCGSDLYGVGIDALTIGDDPDVAAERALEKSGFGVSLSTVLNVLDGLLSPDGVVTIATANHPDLLDKALLRKGRFDLHLEIGALDAQSFTEMFVAFYGEDKKPLVDAFIAAKRYVPVVGAVAQDIFRHESAEDALKQLGQRGNGHAISSGDEDACEDASDFRPRSAAVSRAS